MKKTCLFSSIILYQFKTSYQEKVEALLSSGDVPAGGPLTIPISEVGSHLAGQGGSKMADLGEIKNRIHLKVPEGFAITAQAYYRFTELNDLQTEIHRRVQAASVDRLDDLYKLSSDLQEMLSSGGLSRR